MLRLNIRHQLPQTAQRMQRSQLDIQTQAAELHTDYKAPRSNQGATQPTIEIDSYPSRHSYGYTNHTDFAREHGQEGLSGVRSGTSSHTQRAWSIIENGAKRGNDIPGYYKNKAVQELRKQYRIEAQAIPDPKVHITPGEVVGEPDPGYNQMNIQTHPDAEIRYTPSKAETYVKDQGFLRQWTTEDRYDIYA